jgi:hypothetical protein
MPDHPYESRLDSLFRCRTRRISRFGVAAVVVAAMASACLVFAVSHVRINRTPGLTIVTLVGPAASWITPLVLTGWVLSFGAMALAAHGMKRRERWSLPLGALAIYLAVVNIMGSFVFAGFVGD